MAVKATDLDARLARLERLALAAFTERHGVQFGTTGMDFRVLRRQATLDAQAILREQQQPQLETRGAA